MPRRRGGFGPGAGAVGGPRVRPPRPPTPFAGGATGGAVPVGGPRAAPGALPAGPPPGAAGRMPMAIKKGGSVEKHKEATEKKRERHEKLARGGAVHKDEAQDRALFRKMEKEERPGKREREEVSKHARGGPVLAGHMTHGMRGYEHPKGEGIHPGGEHKRGAGLPGHGAPAGPGYGTKGPDSRTHRPHSGKAT